jgi:ABC-2 type transport system ATP-binding protein
MRMRSGGVSPKVRHATPAKHLPISFARRCETPPDLIYSSGLLRLDRVRKRYGTLLAVDDLTLEIRPGEIFGLLGPNGAGKSTTVNLAVGLLSPDEGTVTIGDAGSPAGAAVRRRIGVAPQALAVYDQLTGRENLEFFGRMYGLNRSTLAARVSWALDFVQLEDRAPDRAVGYSGGMKRRLNLAAALVHDPELILLDEPTVGVDPQSRNAIFDSIEALRAQGRTIIYTTHYMEEAARLCDRVGIIDHGKLLAVDTVAALLATHGGAPTLVVARSDGEHRVRTTDPLGELNRLAAVESVGEFRLERPTLEQVFLQLTGRQLRD